MALVTVFSAPKAFTDPDTARRQRNAIGSWKQLPNAEIILMGNDEGIAETARALGTRHAADVALNPNGVPLISSMFQHAREMSESGLLLIVNTDIILMADFMAAAAQIESLRSGSPLRDGFVLVSRRWDLDVQTALKFDQGWESRLRQELQARGRLHRPTGSDLFLFPRDCYQDIPDFAIGRAGWDNWMIYQARRQGWSVVDATPSMTVVHQEHDYRHLPGAKPHYDHPDTQVNMRLAGGQAAIRYSLLDSTHTFVSGRLERPEASRDRDLRKVELLLRRIFFFLPERTLESIARPKRWSKRINRLFRKNGA